MGSTVNADLPEELTEEILLRLPVKSLCRFKCVCKQWCALLGSPSFINQHFAHERNDEHLFIWYSSVDKKQSVVSLYVDDTFKGYDEPDHLQMPLEVTDLIGPLNGVFWVIGFGGSTALVNPSMRQFKPLPVLPIHHAPHSCFLGNWRGFGLDPVSGGYKFVWIRSFLNDLLFNPLVSICASGSDSWRHLEDVDLVEFHLGDPSLCSTYLNEIYWLIQLDLDESFEFAILAFDMRSEKFQTIRLPDCIKSEPGNLVLCGDSLAFLVLLDFESDAMCVEVWMMKNEKCWIRSQTVGPFEDIPWPLGFWKNDELLYRTRKSSLFLYNLSTQNLRALYQRMGYGFRKKAFVYKESLVSIKGEAGSCLLWDTSSEFVKDILKCSPSNS